MAINSIEAWQRKNRNGTISSSRTCNVQRRHKKEGGNNRDQHTDRKTDEIDDFFSV